MIGLNASCNSARRSLIKFVRVHDLGEERVNLSDPHTNLFWCALPLQSTEQGGIVVDRLIPQSWEELSLESIDIFDLLEQFPFFESYLDVLSDYSIEEVLTRMLCSKPDRFLDAEVDVIHSCALQLPNGIELLMEMLRISPSAFDLAKRLSVGPDDSQAICKLEEWLKDRDAVARTQTLSAELDCLAKVDFRLPTLSRSMIGALRSHTMPRKRACLVATARNEGAYLLEWVAYHLAIGFEHIFIYANNNDDDSDVLLSILAAHGVVTFIRNIIQPSTEAQIKAYSHALSFLPDILDYDWALFCDLDEFFVFDTSRYRNLEEFLATRDPSCNAIALQWLWFGNYGARHLTEGGNPYTHRFKLRHADVHPAIKTIFRPRYFHFSHPHYPFAIRGKQPLFQDCEGRDYRPQPNEFAFSAQPTANAAGINHYVYKSIEDCLWKFCRNGGDQILLSGRRAGEIANDIGGRLKMFDMQRETVVDERIIGCVPDLSSAMLEIRSLSGVDAATASVEGLMRKRVGQLRDELLALDMEEQTEFSRIVVGLLQGEDLYQTMDADVSPRHNK